ncbi:unnamed protein product [Caenorhabditis bovis]|uniref:UBA domain-containing protein n=1 Tax=Caenorhabditis bovis TaxID=2654633 RepID=A0A8S1F8Z8_9PELO|nr:unnamed protein product [Caenorhabditis bovis]
MSYKDVFHDYIQDIPLNIGRSFFPTPNITLKNVEIPHRLVLTDTKYSFEAEKRACEQFKTFYESPSQPVQTSYVNTPDLNPRKPETYLNGLPQEVLVPCPVTTVRSDPNLIPTKSSNESRSEKTHSMIEFETQNSVFDDVELLALDDKAALHQASGILLISFLKLIFQILMSCSQSSSSVMSNSVNNNNENKIVKPPVPLPRSISLEPVVPTHVPKDSGLKQRLITKGFRTDIIDICMNKIPKKRHVHIEYYMKGCRTIEKSGKASISEAADFLVSCDLKEKQDILNYSESCAQLLLMGFAKMHVFECVRTENGDREKALNKILPLS